RLRADQEPSSQRRTKLKFHSIHGVNIVREQSGSRVARTKSFGDGIAFSNRPIAIDELVSIRQTEVSDAWSGVLRVGLTSTDPATLRSRDLPQTVFPAWASKSGFWLRTLPDRYARQDCLLQFSLASSGVISYTVNGRSKGTFMESIDTTDPLWVVVDLYGKAKAIEFESVDLSPPTRDARQVLFAEQPVHSVQREFATRLRVASPPARPTPTNNSIFSSQAGGTNVTVTASLPPSRPTTSFVRPPSLRSLSIFGFTLGGGGGTAERAARAPSTTASTPTSSNSRPRPGRLPPIPNIPAPDTPLTLRRAFISRVAAPGAGDEEASRPPAAVMSSAAPAAAASMREELARLCYRSLSNFGDVVATNEEYMRLDRDLQAAATAQPQTTSSASSLASLAATALVRSSPPSSSQMTSATRANQPSPSSSRRCDDCAICMEAEVNAVIYRCGHMCACYDCAMKIKREGQGCPICRKPMIDVIKTYKS
ncbi:hypothetical protein PMAYCL1PPCAC_27151, partial [Pristionchus mayeri]